MSDTSDLDPLGPDQMGIYVDPNKASSHITIRS